MSMIPYLAVDDAFNRTAQWASHVGCGQSPVDVTRYWYGVQTEELPAGVVAAIIVPNADPGNNNHRLSQLIRENQLAEAEIGSVVSIYNEWAIGVAYAVGDIVAYNDRAYACRQAHTSQADWSPTSAFTLWVVHRANEPELPWVPCEPVQVGWTRTHGATVYECIQAHVTQSDWAPPNVPALWSAQSAPGDGWTPGVAYAVNDEVTYLESRYRCLQAHTAQVGWEPPNVPALWQLIDAGGGDDPLPWVQPTGGHDAYNLGDRVTYNGQTWESTINANVWAPGVYGWVVVP